MNKISYDNIDRIYIDICRNLLTYGDKVANTNELNDVQIELTDINKSIVSVRNISPSYLFGEWLWYFNGSNSTDFISQFGSMWSKLTDDGMTANSAYGYIMDKKFGFDQINKIIDLLKKDPNSRRAIININTPNEKVIVTKDEPCTIALQFMIRDGKLNCTCMMRSNDIYLGFPYDVAFFTELQKRIADELSLEYGTYTHFVGSMHVYERDLERLSKIAWNPIPKPFRFNRRLFKENEKYMFEYLRPGAYTKPKNVLLNLLEDLCDYKETK